MLIKVPPHLCQIHTKQRSVPLAGKQKGSTGHVIGSSSIPHKWSKSLSLGRLQPNPSISTGYIS